MRRLLGLIFDVSAASLFFLSFWYFPLITTIAIAFFVLVQYVRASISVLEDRIKELERKL